VVDGKATGRLHVYVGVNGYVVDGNSMMSPRGPDPGGKYGVWGKSESFVKGGEG
jgi:hypothetical protein